MAKKVIVERWKSEDGNIYESEREALNADEYYYNTTHKMELITKIIGDRNIASKVYDNFTKIKKIMEEKY